ncbi:coiled-coil domain-containing protein 181 [Onthophagus taurus]|uniref:coiled-coil domain-containing protein 181 n=1 Tax=Onthophagus taurus TaxID=166361 RepID=UPI0039BE9346
MEINESLVTEEDDCEIYFLQPASSPYNIKEKLEKANKALLEESFNGNDREFKIKFKEVLVDYEPDLTDDDVQSFESYNEVDFNIIEKEQGLENNLINNKLELNIFTPVIEEEYDEDIQTCENDEIGVIENKVEDENEIFEVNEEEEIFINEEINFSDEIDKSENDETITSSKDLIFCEDSNSIERKRIVKKSKKHIKIDCKSHCIDKLPDLNLTISKLKINEKPDFCPALKLLKRRCCEKNVKNDQKLPQYTGLRSEYGLSLVQLEMRRKRKEYSKIREEKRRNLIEEYKKRKMQQNEEIFYQWLKTIEKRKVLEERNRQKSKYSAKIVNFTKNLIEERPKTANYLVGSVKRTNKRPETACVYVQISSDLLKQKGIQVGNLIFKEIHKNNKNEFNIVSF